jgi:aryl-alcohol dehydrogenase-like predicted oxidoreductase
LEFTRQRILGRSGLEAGRLGVAAAYGAPAEAFLEAFERGSNYFLWGSVRRKGMLEAIRNISAAGKRDGLIVVVQSFTRSAAYLERSLTGALKRLGIDHADVFLLGWYNKRPPQRIIQRALEMKQKGLFKCLALSGHNRKLFRELERDGFYDIFHVRYNAAHRGAEHETFPYFQELPHQERPGIVTFTSTRWGRLLDKKKTPPGEEPPRGSDCYRFVLSHPDVDLCITGPRNTSEMREALGALELGPMSPEELERMRRIGDYLHGR